MTAAARADSTGAPAGSMKRATSMLFDVLGRELDATEAQTLLNQATQRVINTHHSKDSPQGKKPVVLGSNPSSGADDTCSTNVTSIASDSPSITQSSVASAQLPAQQAQPTPDGSQAAAQGVGVDLEADRAALAAHLTQFTPEVIFVELLGSLFIHPDRLQMESLLGQGAYATVHRATLLPSGDEGLNQAVAVKRLKPEVLSSTSDLKDFLLEVNILRKMKHPNIVGIRGIGASDLTSLATARSSMYVVMEALEGGTLRDLVTRQMTSSSLVYEAKHALQWGKQVAAAMHYLHAVCRPMIIHRDMKLENILLSDGAMDARVAKLADFGLHKRARYNTATGTLMPAASINTTLPGPVAAAGGHSLYEDLDKSYYGGNFFNPNASVHYGGSVHPGRAGGGINPSDHGGAASRGGPGAGSVHGGGGSIHGGRLGVAGGGGPSVHGSRLNPVAAAGGGGGSTHGGVVQGRSPSESANNSSHNGGGYMMTALQLGMSGLGPGGPQPAGAHGMRKVGSLKELVDLAATSTSQGAGVTTAQPSTTDASSAPFGRDSLKGFRAAAVAAEEAVPFGRGSLKGLRQSEEQEGTQHHVDDAPVHGGASALGVLSTTPQASLARADTLPAGQQQPAPPPVPAAPAASLPAGVATLLTDPAQASNLQRLHVLLAGDEHTDADGAWYAGGSKDLSTTHRNPSLQNPSFRTVTDPSNPSVSAGKTEVETDRLHRDASVHRKMLALMALDAQGPYCVRPEGDFCPMPNQDRLLPTVPPQAQELVAPGAFGGGMKAIPEHDRSSLDISVGRQSARDSHEARASSQHNTTNSIPEGHQMKGMLEGSRHQGGSRSGKAGRLMAVAMEAAADRPSFKKGQAYFAEATQQVGSLMYMAPELVNGGQYNHKVDVFSFGIMLYELFIGKLIACKGELMAGGEEEVMAYVKRRAEGERERLPVRWPQPLRDLIAECWAQDPAARPTFEQLGNRLEAMEVSGVLDSLIPSVHVRSSGPSSGCCVVM